MTTGILEYRTNDLLDADGRPLGEVSSPLYDVDRTEVVACPYPDGRKGRPMNVSALRQLAGPWPSLIATVADLAGPAPTVHRAWWVSMAGTAAPLMVDGPVPVAVSALYKAALGLSQVTSSLLLADDGVADVPFASLGDADALFAFLDEGRWLHGQVQVCAGSGPAIREIGDALAGRLSPRAPTLPEVEPWLGDVAVGVVALQAAYLASAYRAVRRGDGAGLEGTPAEQWLQRVPPWLRAVASVPNRPPEHVRRLFPTGRTPETLERFLAAGPDSAGRLAERFAELVHPARAAFGR